MALTEASFVIVKLLQRFDILENADSHPEEMVPAQIPALVWNYKRGVCIRLYSSDT